MMMRIGNRVNFTLILDNFDNFVWDAEIMILSNMFSKYIEFKHLPENRSFYVIKYHCC